MGRAIGVNLGNDFNPRAPCGARRLNESPDGDTGLFQSTRPLRGATTRRPISTSGMRNFNPRAPCGARLSDCTLGIECPNISIHAPLAGRDVTINPIAVPSFPFQSTRPLRGATPPQEPSGRGRAFQSTRPLRGATDVVFLSLFQELISIHAPLAGRDCEPGGRWRMGQISIHAPLAGRDFGKRWSPRQAADFNPRAPCGARPENCAEVPLASSFQSTRPLRGATFGDRPLLAELDFNPRAPCGARRAGSIPGADCRHFNPRAPCGARLAHFLVPAAGNIISIHAPLAGRDTICCVAAFSAKDFNPRAPCGARLRLTPEWSHSRRFQSTRPLRGATACPEPRNTLS